MTRGLGLAEHPWRVNLMIAGCISVLLDLDGDHLRLRHLTVEKLNYPLQLWRDRVRHEYQPQPPGDQIRLHGLPVFVGVCDVRERVGQRAVWLDVATALIEPPAQRLNVPVRRRVRGVIEQLPYDLTPNAA